MNFQIFFNIISNKKFAQTVLIKLNLKPKNLDIFVRPNAKCEIVDYPMIMLA